MATVTKNEAKRDKAEAFKRVGSKRVTNAIRTIRGVAKVANRNAYTYTDEQASRIVETLRDELNSLEAAFTAQGKKEDASFKL